MVALCGGSRTVMIWNVSVDICLRTFDATDGPNDSLSMLACAQDGLFLATATVSGCVAVWDLAALLAPASWHGLLRQHHRSCHDCPADNSRPSAVCRWKAHSMAVTSLEVVQSPSRKTTLLTGSCDGNVKLWSVQGDLIGTCGLTGRWADRLK